MTCACRILAAGALAAAVTLLEPAAAAGQADSGRADSVLTRSVGWASRTTVSGWVLRSILADDPTHLLGLVPGVVLRRAETGLAGASSLSIRGGAPGEASVYIDGAPVRFLTLGTAGLALGSGSVADVALTTGPPDLGLPDLRDGVIEYVTRAGAQKLAGSVRFATDDAFAGVGFRRFEGSLGGPLAGVSNATWLVGGTLVEQSSHYTGLGAQDIATYVPNGIDTLVAGDTLLSFTNRRVYDWGTESRAHAKLQFAYGRGGTLSVTGVANEIQERFFPGTFALTPTLYTGSRSLGRLVVVNWRHSIGFVRGTPITLLVNASHGFNEFAAGLLEPWSEAVSRDPGHGISFEPLQFFGADSIPNPLMGQIIRNIRTNSGMRVPFLNHDELRISQTSRGNPYGMEAGWPEQGSEGPLSMISESRTEGRWSLAWDAAYAHRVTVGGDLRSAYLSSYSARSVISLSGLDAYRAQPRHAGVYLTDRFGRGALRGDIALRYDIYGRVGRFADTPGRIYTHPEFNLPAALMDDTAYTNSIRRVMTPGRAHHGASLRAAVERDLGPRATLRAAYGRWLEPPPLRLVLHNVNADLDFTNVNDAFGRDVEYGYASLAEVGVRHDVRPGLVTDIAVYRRSRPQYQFRIQPFDDPANPGDIANVNALAKVEDVVDLGLEVAIDWRVGSWAIARVAYSVRQTDLNIAATFPTGTVEAPSYSTHGFTVAAIARPPRGMLSGFEASALLRLTSGTWYNYDPSFVSPGDITPAFDAVGLGQNERLPWTKRLDVRLRRTVTLGPSEWSFFAEARNLFAWRNFLALFTETGSVNNIRFRHQLLDAEFQNLETEAFDNGALAPNGDITLPADCSGWTANFGPSGPVNCVALKRVEARFGNGDRVYNVAEREAALYAFYNAFFGPQRFHGAGRSVRLGVEIHW